MLTFDTMSIRKPETSRANGQAYAAGTTRYLAGTLKPFDQKDQMFMRATWDPAFRTAARKYYGYHDPKTNAGYTLAEMALNDAGWWVELAFGSGNFIGREGLGAWEAVPSSSHRVRPDMRLENAGPARLATLVKRAARLYGASLVGICALDTRWLYTNSYHTLKKESRPIVLPEGIRWAVVMAHEMDFDAIAQSPDYVASAGASAVYSRMAVTAGLLAQYIRGLGYRALPLGNDTALSIPLAIDAGLGELGRAGWLITREYGPRVRLNKVLTDLPLVPDKPVDFGAWDFCQSCRKCARFCPGRAIEDGPPTDRVHNVSNRQGLLRWPVNAEKCFNFMAELGTDCGVCLRVCPFNKQPSLLHRAVGWGVDRLRGFDPLFIKADDALGYGRPRRDSAFWST
jgi:reductive dehalogenase